MTPAHGPIAAPTSSVLRWLTVTGLVLAGFGVVQVLPPDIGSPPVIDVSSSGGEFIAFSYDPTPTGQVWAAGAVLSNVLVLTLGVAIGWILVGGWVPGRGMGAAMVSIAAALAVAVIAYYAYGLIARPGFEIGCPVSDCEGLAFSVTPMLQTVFHFSFAGLVVGSFLVRAVIVTRSGVGSVGAAAPGGPEHT